MANEFEIKVSGLQEVQRSLFQYSQQLGDKVVIAALTQGARVVQRAAKQRAPQLTGRLKRYGVVVRKSKINSARRSANTLGVYLTLRRGRGKSDPKDVFYGRFVEDGFTARGGQKIPGQKFINTAFLSNRESAAKLIVRSVEVGSDLLKRKLGFK